MPLRTAPLPRMAGHLSFMRAQTKTLDDLGPGDLAVLGVPFEDTTAPHAGQSMAPRALRETSVYFGWHANPQFSHPIDIDARQEIRTDGLHERLCDLGDLPKGEDQDIQASLSAAMNRISARKACAIILGGSDPLAKTVKQALTNCQVIQLGERITDQTHFHVAPLTNGPVAAAKADETAQTEAFSRWRNPAVPLFVRFDLSVFETSVSGLCDRPRLGGHGLETVARWLSAIGQQEVSAIMLTGLNPSRPGMGVIKVGQRLMVTALLAFIYARLGFGMEHREGRSSMKRVL